MTFSFPESMSNISGDLIHGAHILDRENKDVIEKDPESLYSEMFHARFPADSFERLLSVSRNIGIILNDRNRPTPSRIVLEHLFTQKAFKQRIRTIHIATGTHKKPLNEDLRTILGNTYDTFKGLIHIHVAEDKGQHRFHGTTSRGTEVYLDKALDDNDFFILVNSVEPHYFAGFTGGRKSVIPGMAYFNTVEKNLRSQSE